MNLTGPIESKNALITGTSLGNESHGIFTVSLTLEYGIGCQCFGGYAMDDYDKRKKKRLGTAYGMAFIMRVLEIAGVDSWEKLKGKYIRVEATHSEVIGIGHITKDDWFYPEQDLKEYVKDATC